MEFKIPIKEIVDKLLENRLVSRKAVIIISMGLMIFLLPIPQQYVIEKGDVVKLEANYLWTLYYVGVKAFFISILGVVGLVGQFLLDRLKLKNGSSGG